MMFLFLGFIGSALLGIGKRVVGGHLVGKDSLAAVNGVEGAVSGLGVRFFIGAGVTLYLTQPTVRDAINNLIGAVRGRASVSLGRGVLLAVIPGLMMYAGMSLMSGDPSPASRPPGHPRNATRQHRSRRHGHPAQGRGGAPAGRIR